MSDGIEVYMYQADLFCKECGDKIRADIPGYNRPDDPDDECSYDSDQFPKGPYGDGGGEADSPHHCGNHECGKFLGNPLTYDGMKYVAEAVVEALGREYDEGSVALRTWLPFYFGDGLDNWLLDAVYDHAREVEDPEERLRRAVKMAFKLAAAFDDTLKLALA
jgi:hypothetical protein